MTAYCASQSRVRRFDQRIEHGLQIERRAADDLEHIGGGGLLLQRFGKIVGALAQLVEQPRVLDRDDGLVGEILDELDLLVGERPDLLAVDASAPTSLSSLQHRHANTARLRRSTLQRRAGDLAVGRTSVM